MARSNAEAKFQAIALGVCEGLWLKHVMEELNISTKFPMKMFCDTKQPSTSPIIRFIMTEPNIWKYTDISSRRKLRMGSF